MAKKNKAPAGAPLWIVTFSDLMSLLLTFFVLMLSFSVIEIESFHRAMGSLKEALGVFQGSQSVMFAPADVTSSLPTKAEILKSTADIKSFLKDNGMESMVEMELTGEGLRFKMNSSLLFAVGGADLKPRVKKLLDDIGFLTERFASHTIIEGHTDDVPMSSSEFPSNWHLSSARSIAVVEYITQSLDIDPSKYHSVAYSEYKPRVPNTSPENRAKNRRVEIMIKLIDPPKNYSDDEIDQLLEIMQPEEMIQPILDTLRSF